MKAVIIRLEALHPSSNFVLSPPDLRVLMAPRLTATLRPMAVVGLSLHSPPMLAWAPNVLPLILPL